ncbi:MAG: organic hydroperoxide resistance protein [Thermaurantiacus sp.]
MSDWKPIYTAQAHAVAGRDGRVTSEDGHLDVVLAPPAAMGGSGRGTNPEQLFAAGYAACFHSALLFLARETKADTSGSSADGKVSIGPNPDGPGFRLAAHLTVALPALAQADAEALVEAAHKVCPYSNATRGNIDVSFDVKGA